MDIRRRSASCGCFQALTADDIRLFAKMTGTELVVINDKTELNAFEQQLEMLDTMASFRR